MIVVVDYDQVTGNVDFALDIDPAVFSDGFETGTTFGWDLTVP